VGAVLSRCQLLNSEVLHNGCRFLEKEESLHYIPSFETTKLYFTFLYLYQILEASSIHVHTYVYANKTSLAIVCVSGYATVFLCLKSVPHQENCRFCMCTMG
jgi:hypothetical protein